MKILIVDDHPALLAGLAAFLRGDMAAEVLEAGDAETAYSIVSAHADLDLVITDLSLPGDDGHTALAAFGRLRPDLPLIVLSASENASDIRLAANNGALGYVPKSASREALVAAIRTVLSGGVHLDPPGQAPDASRPAALTRRQAELLRRLGEGQSNKVMAMDLDLSEKTVKAHLTALYKALGVANRTQAALLARSRRT